MYNDGAGGKGQDDPEENEREFLISAFYLFIYNFSSSFLFAYRIPEVYAGNVVAYAGQDVRFCRNARQKQPPLANLLYILTCTLFILYVYLHLFWRKINGGTHRISYLPVQTLRDVLPYGPCRETFRF